MAHFVAITSATTNLVSGHGINHQVRGQAELGRRQGKVGGVGNDVLGLEVRSLNSSGDLI